VLLETVFRQKRRHLLQGTALGIAAQSVMTEPICKRLVEQHDPGISVDDINGIGHGIQHQPILPLHGQHLQFHPLQVADVTIQPDKPHDSSRLQIPQRDLGDECPEGILSGLGGEGLPVKHRRAGGHEFAFLLAK